MAQAHSSIDLAEEMVDACSAVIQDFKTNDLAQAIPLAGLAKSSRLLRGMLTVRSAGDADLVGLFLRPIVEVWMVSMTLLLGGEERIPGAFGDLIRHVRFLTPDKAVDWNGPTDRLKWEELASDVFELIAEGQEFPNHEAAAELLYNLYRWLSTWQTHGGMGALIGFIEFGDEDRSQMTISLSGSSERAEPAIRLAATFVGSLGTTISQELEIPIGAIESLTDTLIEGTSMSAVIRELVEN